MQGSTRLRRLLRPRRAKITDPQGRNLSHHANGQGGERARPAHVRDVLSVKSFPSLICVPPKEKLSRAISLMQEYSISQLPVIEADKVVGSLSEASVMKLLHDGINFEEQRIGAVMGAPMPALEGETDVCEAFRVLLSGASGIVVLRDGKPQGVISRSDLVCFWTQTKESPDEV